MDLSNAEQCLVYPSPPHPQQIDASIPGPCWQMNHHSPPVSSSSSATPSQMYPVPNRTTGQLAYPQQSTSSAYHQPQPVPQYIGQQQSLAGGHVQGSNVIALGSPQINGSIGPSRVLTRRQARAAQMTTLQRPSRRDDTSLQPGLADDSNAVNDRHHQAVYFMHPMSRPHTPNNLVHPSHYQRPPDHTVMTLGNSPLTMSSHSASPTYPSTPLATPFSPYLPYHVHSRSDSTSTSNPRSASPALSVASALTSISSASGPNTHTFSTFPPNGANMSPVIQRQKHRKHRLFNVDRKEICIYHKENPTARQEDIAAKYGVERSTISKILKNKAKWLNVPDHEDMLVAKHRPSKFPEIEEELRKWLVEAKENNTLLTDSTIRTKAKEVARFLQIPEDKFKASSGWVENFKQRHGIRKGVWHGDGKLGKAARAVGAGWLPPNIDELNERQLQYMKNVSPPTFHSQPASTFLGRSGTADAAHPQEDDAMDLGVESEDESPSPDRDQVDDRQVQPSMTLQPAWQSHSQPQFSSTSTASSSSSSSASTSLSASTSSSISAASTSTSISASSQFQPSCDQSPLLQDRLPRSPPVPLPINNHDHSAHDSTMYIEHSRHHHPPPPPPVNDQIPVAENRVHQNAAASFAQPIPVVDAIPRIATGPGVPEISEVEDAINKVIFFVDAQPGGFLTANERQSLTQIKFALFQAGSGVPFVREA